MAPSQEADCARNRVDDRHVAGASSRSVAAAGSPSHEPESDVTCVNLGTCVVRRCLWDHLGGAGAAGNILHPVRIAAGIAEAVKRLEVKGLERPLE